MNREEAIEILKGAIKKPNTKDGYLGQALTMGIEALENQKSLQAELEEIKAVIQHEKSKHLGEGKYTYTAGLKTAIDLIDKHIKGVDNEIL